MKILLLGDNLCAVRVLESLAAAGHALRIITPFTRQLHQWAPSIQKKAEEENVLLYPLYNPEEIHSDYLTDRIRSFSPDLIVTVYYRRFPKGNLHSLARLGMVNIHASALPEYPGSAPLIWSIIDGQKKTAVSLLHLDGGKSRIALQQEIVIDVDETGYSLHEKAADASVKLLHLLLSNPDAVLEQAQDWQLDSVQEKKQEERVNNISWNDPAIRIHNIVRALRAPLPSAFTFLGQERVLLQKSKPHSQTTAENPGKIIWTENGNLLVATGEGCLELLEVNIAGETVVANKLRAIVDKSQRDSFQFQSQSQSLGPPQQKMRPSETTLKEFLFFGKPNIGEEEIREVSDCLRSGWIGEGPRTRAFEKEFAAYIGCKEALAVSSCTAGLFLSLYALGVQAGDEVITTAMTFAATVNVIEHLGARPVFVDVDPVTLNMNPDQVAKAVTPKTRVILPVHFAGLSCDMNALESIAKMHSLSIVEDAAHAVGTIHGSRKTGAHGNLSCFSFYPNKGITAAEGGMITLNDAVLAEKIRMARLHGLESTAWNRFQSRELIQAQIMFPGFKANMTDIQAAIGREQLKKLDGFIAARERVAQWYDSELSQETYLRIPPRPRPGQQERHSLHLYVVLLDLEMLRCTRNEFVQVLRSFNVGAGVHYVAVPMHHYYRKKYPEAAAATPEANTISNSILSLPLNVDQTEEQTLAVCEAIRSVAAQFL